MLLKKVTRLQRLEKSRALTPILRYAKSVIDTLRNKVTFEKWSEIPQNGV
jgi:hypothetical protein